MTKPRLYLDNCCFNRSFDDQSRLAIRLETEAVQYVCKGIQEGKYDLSWSYMLDMENEDNPYEQKKNAVRKWRKFAKHVMEEENEEIIKYIDECEKAGLKPKDAVHLSCALALSADYFITTDFGILRKTFAGIRIINPLQFLLLDKDGNL